jgi:MFS family permease
MTAAAASASGSSEKTRLSAVHWLILVIAAMGFAFDIYELLVMPLVARPGLSELLGVDPDTDAGSAAILAWTGYIMWGSAISGGVFGLLGGYLTDLLGRRRVLTWSILLYAFSAVGAGLATSAPMLLVFRCTTFVGVCVEFVAAVAWLSELFPNSKQREAVLGYTQAFSSIGGLLVTFAYKFCVEYSASLPAIHGEHAAWRYTLISGLIPAIPLILIRPFLPESPVWREKRALGTLRRPSLAEIFRPEFLRTTLTTTALFACCYGAAFGAIQLTPQIVPGLVPELGQIVKLRTEIGATKADDPKYKELKAKIGPLNKAQQQVVGNVQLYQEMGGLAGRFVLAWLAIRIVSRRKLLWAFLLPGLIVVPLVFFGPAAGKFGPEKSLEMLKWGIALVGFLTVAQFSFWGNYLPRVYPTHVRGTGEGFAANVGGRMIGTAASPLATILLAPRLLSGVSGLSRPASIAYAAAIVGLGVYLVATIVCYWLPEPGHAEAGD